MSDTPLPASVDTLAAGASGPVTVTNADRSVGRRSADGQAALLDWLGRAAPFPVPEVVGVDGPWVVTTALPGFTADRTDAHPEPAALPGAIGAGLAALHALTPPPDLLTGPDAEDLATPADGWASVIERCATRVEDGLVAGLPTPYDRYEPDRLLELLIEGVGGERAGVEPPVLSHGRPSPDRILIDGDRFAGFIELDAVLLADRHLDLATAHLWVAELFGGESVFALYEGYGADPDLARLDRGVLAVRLLGTGPPAS
ncbi:MAG: phosphotransferase [Actinomycetota bacterium]